MLYLVPPPALVSISLDLLCESHQVQPKTSHVLIVPNLMTYKWRRPLGKASDTKFVLNIKSFIWSAEIHESLTVAFVCPYLSNRPWGVKHLDWVDKFKGEVFNLWGKDSSAM